MIIDDHPRMMLSSSEVRLLPSSLWLTLGRDKRSTALILCEAGTAGYHLAKRRKTRYGPR
jgi:hypothetical protein